MTKIKKNILMAITLIGIVITVELTNVYYHANFVPDAHPSICTINSSLDCDGVARTIYAQFLGIPNATWGLILYIFIFFMLIADKLKETKLFRFMEVFKNPLSYIFAVSFPAFLISIGLAFVSFFEIHMICVFCFVTYLLDFIIVMITKDYDRPVLAEYQDSIRDFLDAIKIKKYLISFIIVASLGLSAICYIDISAIFSPQLAQEREVQKFLKDAFNTVEGNILGDPDAKIVIDEYIDYNCGGCYIANLNSHRAVMELKGIRINQHNLPLDKTCNKYMPQAGHPNSCLKARYALAAKRQNKFWNMNDLLMFKSPETEREILNLALSLKLDMEKLKQDVNGKEVANELQAEIEETERLQINATPTLIIGMKRHTGAMNYPEYKEMLIRMGAEER